ncbi:hypothetical protein Shel_09570 [Slackia heliotrinireducens DSM 20476]|uniref:Uncharacterized protein n=1 Tax=Slackia heliotrinireducens (strain ATCC 29202 / DSM 20476 / NCTC 11029 / RHS 1) TaxID=471855 RepID=C7N510_SLAHD|nr:hypothetical protein Shel_09570 [Slackia heliotrinireducens DSM 20476]
MPDKGAPLSVQGQKTMGKGLYGSRGAYFVDIREILAERDSDVAI